MIQGSDAWRQARCGRLTASRIGDALSKTKNNSWSAASRAVFHELLAERLTGRPADHYTSPAMKWGTRYEEDAALAYEFYADCEAEKIGFVPHPSLEWCGASPDRLVGLNGGLEIKCPTTEVHVATIETDAVPKDHLPQCYWNIACTRRAWWDFVSYDPRMPADLHFFCKRIERDDAIIQQMEADAAAFLNELAAKHFALISRRTILDIERAAA